MCLGVRNRVAALLYRQGTLAERHLKVADLVEKTTQGPNVRLGCDRLVGVEIDHFGRPISERGVPLHLVHGQLHLLGGRGQPLVKDLLGRRAKVADHVVDAVGFGVARRPALLLLVLAPAVKENVLDLEIAVNDAVAVQARHALAHIAEHFDHLEI